MPAAARARADLLVLIHTTKPPRFTPGGGVIQEATKSLKSNSRALLAHPGAPHTTNHKHTGWLAPAEAGQQQQQQQRSIQSCPAAAAAAIEWDCCRCWSRSHCRRSVAWLVLLFTGNRMPRGAFERWALCTHGAYVSYGGSNPPTGVIHSQVYVLRVRCAVSGWRNSELGLTRVWWFGRRPAPALWPSIPITTRLLRSMRTVRSAYGAIQARAAAEPPPATASCRSRQPMIRLLL